MVAIISPCWAEPTYPINRVRRHCTCGSRFAARVTRENTFDTPTKRQPRRDTRLSLVDSLGPDYGYRLSLDFIALKSTEICCILYDLDIFKISVIIYAKNIRNRKKTIYLYSLFFCWKFKWRQYCTSLSLLPGSVPKKNNLKKLLNNFYDL